MRPHSTPFQWIVKPASVSDSDDQSFADELRRRKNTTLYTSRSEEWAYGDGILGTVKNSKVELTA